MFVHIRRRQKRLIESFGSMPHRFKVSAQHVGLVTGLCFFAVHFAVLSFYLVNIPWADDWGEFNPWRDFHRQLTGRWLLSTMNAHPRVLHNLVSWILYTIDGRNFIVHATINFLF